ncbi:MAG: class I SAM-dependent methyltransferase, partial [Candidatus Micrarchaeota archaeon]|nr:class I SAM-dependent methyltransferase [Candidatus Micrarchaeota archaeon]
MNRTELNKAHVGRVKAWTSTSKFHTGRTAEQSDSEMNGHLFQALDALPTGSKVLEIGTGKGITLRELRVQYPHLAFYGTNYYTRGQNPSSEKNVLQVEGSELPFRRSTFNFIYSIVTLPYIPDKIKHLEEVHRILKIGGRAI